MCALERGGTPPTGYDPASEHPAQSSPPASRAPGRPAESAAVPTPAGIKGLLYFLSTQTACTRLRPPSVPEAWANATLLRQVHGVRHTRQMTGRNILAFLSRARSRHASRSSSALCGRRSVRAWHAGDCATHICNTQTLDFTGVNLWCRTDPLRNNSERNGPNSA